MSTERAHFFGLRTWVGMVILVGLLGATSPARPVLPGTPPLSYARYHVALEAPRTIFQRQDAALVVRVQNGQGLPVDGIPVAFQVDPAWTQYASIRPTRALTKGGKARAMLQAELIGLIQVTVRVGSFTKRAAITVVMPIARRVGSLQGARQAASIAPIRVCNPTVQHISRACRGAGPPCIGWHAPGEVLHPQALLQKDARRIIRPLADPADHPAS